MATTIGTAVSALLTRVRQSGNISPTNDQATQILTLCQQYVNLLFRRVIITETFATTKEKLLYNLSDFSGDALKILEMRESNRSLVEVDEIQQFGSYEKNWFRNITGSRFEAWHQLSQDYFILYPGKAAASSVVVDFVKATTIYSDYTTYSGTNLEIADEDVNVLLQLSETVLLIKSRKYSLITQTLKKLIRLLEARNVFFEGANLNSLLNTIK